MIAALVRAGVEVVRMSGSHHFLIHDDERYFTLACELMPRGN
ncbi:type II toxin-antitoxin system HicA family toxin [Coleofasciculus sp. FACHB-T130]